MQNRSRGVLLRFNGKEKDDEVAGSGNITTAEFWEYDSRLGRRWNLDPKPFVGVSDYACFMKSPIAFSDVLGDVIGGDKKKAQEVKDAANENIKKLDEEINKLGEEINKRGRKGKEATKDQLKELERLILNKIAYKNVVREIDALENDRAQVYNIISIDGEVGLTEYNEETKALYIYVTGTFIQQLMNLSTPINFLRAR